MAPQYRLFPGAAYDIEVNDEGGMPGDFDVLEQRNRCVHEILLQRPSFLIGNPMRTALPVLQGQNESRMTQTKWDALWNKGVRHMFFAIKLYRFQAEAGI